MINLNRDLQHQRKWPKQLNNTLGNWTGIRAGQTRSYVMAGRSLKTDFSQLASNCAFFFF